MRAIVYKRYGGPEVLELVELPEPKLSQNNVLVRIEAAALNPADLALQAGYGDSIMDAYFPVVPGWDLAGIVEAVGAGVDEFKPGDQVIGYGRQEILHHGPLAERMATPVEALARKPSTMSFDEAAGLPLAGLTAYRAVIQTLKVKPQERVLVLGASGAVGSLAAQLAQHLGASVTGTSSTPNLPYLRSHGIDAISHSDGIAMHMPSAAADGDFDVILDCAGHGALSAAKRLLKPDGRCASVAAHGEGFPMVYARLDPVALNELSRLADLGILRIPVAATFPLSRAAAAQEMLAGRHAPGKIVVQPQK